MATFRDRRGEVHSQPPRRSGPPSRQGLETIRLSQTLIGLHAPKAKSDRATIFGLLVSVGSILAGMVLEGGRVGDIVQVTAGLIVVGGTLGAVMVSSPPFVLLRALRKLSTLVRPKEVPAPMLIDDLVACVTKARKQGLSMLEMDAEAARDPFIAKALRLAMDGVGTDVIRENMELEISLEEQRLDDEARVFESAGGYAPTIGIIGAVLGLIQVMKHLENISEVGHGIAVAFVATVYGVGLANLVLLPIAGKLRALAAQRIRMCEMVLEGVLGIVELRNPRMLRSKLEAYDPRSIYEAPVPDSLARPSLVVEQGSGA